MNAQPFDGITVLDLTQIYNGPYAAFLMAQAGAKVIKIEPPGGEQLRNRPNPLPFAMLNANKQSMVLNLKKPRGKELFLQLADQADVVIENFAPGVMQRLGIGYDVLSARNPRLVFASGSGYGATGPYRDYPAMDVVIQAVSGSICITGFPDGPPVKNGPAICDFFGGIHLYGAIVTALFQRAQTGRGQPVEVAMLDATYFSLSSQLGMFFASGETPRTGNRHGGMGVAPMNLYPTRDGYLAVMANSDRDWLTLLEGIGRTELAQDPRFLTMKDRCANMDALDEAVSVGTRNFGKQELFERLAAQRLPCAPVRELEEVVNDPHLMERGMLAWREHPQFGRMPLPASPLVFPQQGRIEYQCSRALGADSATVLQQRLGLPEAEISALRADGVI
jgi:formyl-CoA transferase